LTAIAFTIYGEAASKANSRRLVTIDGRTRFVKSAKALRFARDAAMQVPMSARVRLDCPVCVVLRMYYRDQRSDMDESALLDVLQDLYTGTGAQRVLVQAGVYRNDRQVRERHVYHGIDARNPRVEVEVRPLASPPADG
jgi:Holliday junction resolvase RusA-like endonuclease